MNPATIVTPIAMNEIASYFIRDTLVGRSPSFRMCPFRIACGLKSRKPGNSATRVANAAQNVVSPAQTQTPAMPPGTLYGRWTSGCDFRRMISVGKIRMYEMVVNVSTTPIITLKASAALPEIRVAMTNTIVENTPDRKLTRTGVPSLAENWPRNRGPAPSYEATTWLRSEPMSHVQALE